MYQEITYANFETRYRNKQYIGAGGFGKVYKVFDYAKNHYVALKVADVRPEWKKFTLKNEVELVNKMNFHRNIARYDACYRFNTGITGEMDFAILKFYEHGNLEQFLSREAVTLNDKKLIIQGILEGIAFLHKNNVIHRDLKAENVLMNREDGVWTPKITDFGLSRKVMQDATITNSAIGLSYSYAAPEQILNKKIHRNVDLWSAGVLIYRVIADELPFKGQKEGDDKTAQSQLELSKRIVNLEIPEKLNQIPEPYQTVIKRCLVLDPMERAQNPEELITILKNSDVVNDSISSIEKTQLIVDEPQVNLESLNGEATVLKTEEPVVEEKVNTPVEKEKPVALPVQDDSYQIPVDNPTVYHAEPQEPTKEKKVEKTSTYEPSTGDGKKGKKALWFVVPLIAGAIGFGVYWFALKPQNIAPIQDAGEVEHIAIDEPVVQKLDELIALEEDVIDAYSNGEVEMLASLESELIGYKEDEAYQLNYRVSYLLSKTQLFQEKGSRNALKQLKMAAKIAIANGHQSKMLENMENDASGDFIELSELQGGKHWNKIKQSLSK